jgi:uncharacterized protein YjbJ (UPF0337 family)
MKFRLNACQKKGVPALVSLLLIGSPAWGANGLSYSFVQEAITQTGHIQKVYNQDEFEGNWKQLKGAIKENWGEFTEDDLLAIEGRTDRFEGKLQERYGERKEEVKEWVDKWLENHPYDAQDRKR